MNARFLAALLALVLLWTGAWTHEVHAVRADADPVVSVATKNPADVQGSIDDHHLDDQGSATLDPLDGATPPGLSSAPFVARARPADAPDAPLCSPHLPGPQRPPCPALT